MRAAEARARLAALPSSPARSRWFWLPALVTAVLVTPFVVAAALYVLGDTPRGAVVAGVLGSGLLASAVARWQRARPAEALAFAALAAGIALGAEYAIWSGVR